MSSGMSNRQNLATGSKYPLSAGSSNGIRKYPARRYNNAVTSPTATPTAAQSDSHSGSFATSRARTQLQPINPRLLKIMGHKMTVASSPLATGPSRRAVTMPVTAPQAWMIKLVENVPKLALENITRSCADYAAPASAFGRAQA
jgi:hypothetical protein